MNLRLSVATRKVWINSRAVLASSPRVELHGISEICQIILCRLTNLSQAVMQLLVARTSAIETRFFSPPLIP